MAEMRAHQDQQTAILRQIQQHLGHLPLPQPDLSASLEPLAPAKDTIPPEDTTTVEVRISPPQLHQRMHHLYLRLPLLDHKTSLYLIVFTYYITKDLSLFWCFIFRVGCTTWSYLILYFLILIYRHHIFLLYLKFFYLFYLSLFCFLTHVVSPIRIRLHFIQEVPLPPFIFNCSWNIEGNVDLSWGES